MGLILMIDLKKIEIIKNRKGFIAALDQSGGSSTKTLINYGYSNKDITSKDVMFDLIHEFRLRVINNNNFNSNYIIGTILFEKTARTTPASVSIMVLLVVRIFFANSNFL